MGIDLVILIMIWVDGIAFGAGIMHLFWLNYNRELIYELKNNMLFIMSTARSEAEAEIEFLKLAGVISSEED